MELSPEETRVLGSLIEKSLATPQHYPLTVNALTAACNQATNRDPVVGYDEHTVEAVADGLKPKGLVRVVHSRSNRAPKYRHVVDEALTLDTPHLAVLALLMLRGPQTAGEIRGRSGRLHEFTAVEDAERCLETLAAAGLAELRGRAPGQKERRWAHLLGAGDTTAPRATDPPEVPEPDSRGGDLRDEIESLQAEVAQLRADLEQLRSSLGGG